MVIWIIFVNSSEFLFIDSWKFDVHICHFLFYYFQFTFINEHNILGTYEISFLTASNFTFINNYIHNWVLFFPWLHLFLFSEVTSLISRSI